MSNERALARVEQIAALDEQRVASLARELAPRFSKDLTKDQANQVARVALAYGLDPFMGELIPYEGQPYITIAGRLRIASEHPMFDGEETVPATDAERKALGAADNEIVWRCTVYRKDRRMPTVAYGRAGGSDEKNFVAKRWTAEMAIKRAQHRALRAAFPNPLPFPDAPEELNVQVDGAVTPEQIKALHAIDREAGVPDDERRQVIDAQFGVTSSVDLTATQASVYMDGRTVADAQTPKPKGRPGPLDLLGRERAANLLRQMRALGNYSDDDITAWLQFHGLDGLVSMPEMTEAQGDALKRDVVNRRRPWLSEPPAESTQDEPPAEVMTGELIGDDFDAEDADGAA